MKKSNFLRRGLCLLLAFVLVAGYLTPAGAVEPDAGLTFGIEKIGNDAVVAVLDHLILCVEFLGRAALRQIVARVEHIGNLYVTRKTLTGGGENDVAARIVRLYDIGNLAELFSIGERRAAEFYNLNAHNKISKKLI